MIKIVMFIVKICASVNNIYYYFSEEMLEIEYNYIISKHLTYSRTKDTTTFNYSQFLNDKHELVVYFLSKLTSFKYNSKKEVCHIFKRIIEK
ncbi:hypothetical protein HERIO_535 [Hepatospora eriocheir]|uniref:Uncharacterized protein n=1 Tax=Hepatospora eriocheir TaxID=1081669 RepID=A0A1X0QD73_9MICR|nr:hypothetical protein HERIO_535 [Hepatospora eriocheir]